MTAPARTRTRIERPWRGVVVPLVVFPLLGVLGGVVWAWWADPATFTVARRQTFMGEEQLGRLFAVEADYAVVGLVGGFVVAAGLGGWLRWSGWRLVIGVLAGSGLAALVSYRVGVAVGPGDLAAAAEAAAPGDAVPQPYEVQTPGLFFCWTLGALAGLVVVVWLLDRDRVDRDRPDLAGSPPGEPASG